MTAPALLDPATNAEQVRKAFSAQAPFFDAYESSNPVLAWMRRQVYAHEEEFLTPGASILELNAGTGIDAVHFAGMGHSVFAIDNAEGMLAELEKKMLGRGLGDRIEFKRLSYTDLDALPDRRFDHVFSNFGGLNCVPDLRPIARQLPRHLKPGATVTMVIMPRICPWELLHSATGNFRLAFRRLSKKGSTANVEGVRFQAYYFSSREVLASFGPEFSLARLRGLASVSPPPHMVPFVRKRPSLYNVLTRIDERLSTIPPFDRWADHFILTLRYSPSSRK
ncbi:MAG TPA: class I SAM-dependent methyltransferase [Bacteroidota bacterium]|nr:class I SAM-dependent methyltransferase [Bacteroidota bacterium]